ncbi:MAG: type II toxin-antitoxin system VapC family toxin [Acidimicrobiaceae bacterium]|nr:type II toxin-antitoxin system VapC family toxin [Acidimicrobiaceae bacterium]MYE76020.1 type II toxin-antitoxin system VapC family toxin [Acidimicrobiaceae bacterium]MYJ41258.1 type II toxin-antitoxin system VapC family toxin [Acidimicrobiaceae bacterium]MYJ80505.1 type II toxin-antitoxin system VapC family toxin [Acidimicrobiaceae bacterium]
MIVVDASAAVEALIHGGEARQRLTTERVAAPHLVDAEVMHALRRLTARGALDDLSAHRAVRRWRGAPVRRFAMHALVDRVWAMRHNLSAYDACYVALAEALDRPLLTADHRLAAAPTLKCPVVLLAGRESHDQ